MRRTPAWGVLALGLSLALTACGPDVTDTPVAVSATEHNAADVTFATDMVQHHAQALAMVDLTVGRDLDPDVTALAEDIRATQGPEIETMVDWLSEWDEEVPETVRDHANAGHGDEMPGTSGAALDALGDAPADEFQDRWLDLMIEHHEGAVAMAETETREGQYAAAVELAGDIVESQSGQITDMEALRY